MKLSFKGVLQSVAMAHTVGILLVVLLSCVAMLLMYPSESITLIGILSSSLGSACLGMYLRGMRCTVVDALVCGLIYGGILLLGSFVLSGDGMKISYRMILFGVMIILAILPSWLFKKKKKRRRIRR